MQEKSKKSFSSLAGSPVPLSRVVYSLYNRDRPTKEWASTAKNAVISLSPSLPLRYHYVTFDYGPSKR